MGRTAHLPACYLDPIHSKTKTTNTAGPTSGLLRTGFPNSFRALGRQDRLAKALRLHHVSVCFISVSTERCSCFFIILRSCNYIYWLHRIFGSVVFLPSRYCMLSVRIHYLCLAWRKKVRCGEAKGAVKKRKATVGVIYIESLFVKLENYALSLDILELSRCLWNVLGKLFFRST